MAQRENRGTSGGFWDLGWFLVWALASSIWCVTAADQLSATYDEPVYIDSGLKRWRTGSHHDLLTGAGVMPLVVDLDTLPLALWERWRGAPFDTQADWGLLLPVARAGTLAFWWLLLFYGWRIGRHLAGPWGGRLAVALLACEPTLLAHASLATTDIGLTACLLALVYHFRTGREARWGRRVGLPALWFAAAFLAKSSGLVLGALCLLTLELERLIGSGALLPPAPLVQGGRKPAGWEGGLRPVLATLWASTRDLSSIIALGGFLALFYCGNDRDAVRPLVVSWASWLPAGPLGQTIACLAEHVRSLHNGYHGFKFQVHHNLDFDGDIYLLGEVRTKPFWYYFPLALSVKLSLTLLFLPLLVAVCRPRALVNWACLAALVLLASTPMVRVQIGIRLVLPLVALATAGLAAGLVRAWRTAAPGWRQALLSGGAGAGVLWVAWSAVAVWPHGLCYTNELWGGTAQGYRYLSDSNYDWGQGLKELTRWQREHGLARMDVWYFGTDPALKTLPLHNVNLEAFPLRQPAEVLAHVQGHILAASSTMVYGATHGMQAAAFLRSRRPVSRTSTYFIYDFTDGQAPGEHGPTQQTSE